MNNKQDAATCQVPEAQAAAWVLHAVHVRNGEDSDSFEGTGLKVEAKSQSNSEWTAQWQRPCRPGYDLCNRQDVCPRHALPAQLDTTRLYDN